VQAIDLRRQLSYEGNCVVQVRIQELVKRQGVNPNACGRLCRVGVEVESHRGAENLARRGGSGKQHNGNGLQHNNTHSTQLKIGSQLPLIDIECNATLFQRFAYSASYYFIRYCVDKCRSRKH